MTDGWDTKELKILLEHYPRGADVESIRRMLPHRTRKAIEVKAEKLGLKRNPAFMLDNSRVGYFDIETNGLKANFHLMLSWYIKERGTDHYDSYTLGAKDFAVKDKTKVDYESTKRLCEAMKRYDYLCTYYGTNFDLPFTRSRAMFHRLPYPTYGSIKHIDVYFSGRGRILTHSKRLEVVSKFFGIQGKTPLEGSIWVGAALGDERSLKYIAAHCKADTEVLEAVHNKLMPYMGLTRRSI